MIDIAPEFDKEPSQAVVKVARDSLAAIKRANIRPLYAKLEMAINHRYSILSDS